MAGSFPDRWLVAGAGQLAPRQLARVVFTTAALSLALIAALAVNHRLQHHFPTGWMALVTALAIAMSRARYAAHEVLIIRLWQLLGAFSAFYALVHYPLMPPLPTPAAERLYAALLLLWGVALVSGIACLRVPSLALLPPAFLLWSSYAAGLVTGLPHKGTLDVDPLPEVALCLGLTLAIVRVHGWGVRRLPLQDAEPGIDPAVEFAGIGLVFAIGLHLANYFWSAIAKLTLDGPILSWLRFNNPLNIYLAALDDDHVTFSQYASAARGVAELLDRTHLLINAVVLGAQFVAIAAFWLPRRLLIVLLFAFDAMHMAIAVSAGANFWPWVILNVAIAAIVMRSDYRQPRPLVGLIAAGFIGIAPLVANVAKLGWYDSGANNKVFLQAVDAQGRRYSISPNYFTFYSYPIGHMSYGMPEPATALDVGDPNGGTPRYAVAKAAAACDLATLMRPRAKHDVPRARLARFVIDYNAMVRSIENRVGVFPYNLYPHHFYVRPALMRPFDLLDKDSIVAYVYRRESVCLSYVDGHLRRRLVSTGEFRIDVPHG